MAVAAFKSTSRRATRTNPPPPSSSDKENARQVRPASPKKQPPRRSRSVSAVPRRSHLPETSTSSTTTTTTSDFLIKRDNPLYWTAVSPTDNEKDNDFDAKNQFNIVPNNAESSAIDGGRIGRSVFRNGDHVKTVSGIGRRSLSRVDIGRRGRSVSRGPVARGHFVNSQSDVEQQGGLLTKHRNRSDLNAVTNVKRCDLVRRSSDSMDQMKILQTRSDGSATNLPSSPTRSWEDGNLGGSFSDAEERTIKAFCEQMKSLEGDDLGGDTSSHIYETVRSEVRRAVADIQNDLESAIRRCNATALVTANVTDIPPDLVNPSAVELVLDIRREYAIKLEQSQERARQLQADLAVEEHRGLELSRILKEVLPDPKTSTVQKSRPVRKSSIERRKMSKRLTEEAMAYFDECVSLSTFDSSDFSSPEDPPINLVGGAAIVTDGASFSQPSSNTAANYCPRSDPINKQESSCGFSHDISLLSTSDSSKDPTPDEVSPNSFETEWGHKSQFSFASKPSDTFELQQDIRKYVKNFKKDFKKVNINSRILRSTHYDPDEYSLQASSQSMLFDNLFFKSRIETGSMLLCSGGIAISLSPFASLI